MKPEAQRIAIAEVCGWWGNRNGLLMRPPLNNSDYCEIPDYLHDLNAMNEAVSSQPYSVKKAMRYWLQTLCDEMTAHEATASQRAEAFLRTIGKWSDE